MATVNGIISDVSGDNSVKQVLWANLTTANADGAPLEWAAWTDKSIHFTGTFGAGGTVKLQGSNNGSDWQDLGDPQGTAISKSAAALEQITEITRYVRPFVSAGDGSTSITATLIVRRATPMRT